jgi:hypothetical protein
MNGNMRHNQSYLTAHARRSNTPGGLVMAHNSSGLSCLNLKPLGSQFA